MESGASQESYFTQLLRNVFRLGSGEVLARLCGGLAVILIGHKYGIVILGIYALAQGMSQCLQPLIDFGLRHVGARLMARFPGSASEIIHGSNDVVSQWPPPPCHSFCSMPL